MPSVNDIAELRIDLPLNDIITCCQQFGVRELAVFGSVLSNEFSGDSDPAT